MAETLTKREAAKKPAAWEPRVGDAVRIPGGGGIGKDLYGQVDRIADHPGYLHLQLEDTGRNPPHWRGNAWSGRASAAEFLFRPDPETLSPPGEDGGGGEDMDSNSGGAVSTEAAPAACEEMEPADEAEPAEEAFPAERESWNRDIPAIWWTIEEELKRREVNPASIAILRQACKMGILDREGDLATVLSYVEAIHKLHPEIKGDSVGFFAEALQYMGCQGKKGRRRTNLYDTISRLREDATGLNRGLLERALMVQDALHKVPVPPLRVGPYLIRREIEVLADVPVWAVRTGESLPNGAAEGSLGSFDCVGGRYKPRPCGGAAERPMLSSAEAAIGWLVMAYQKTYGQPAPGLVATFPGEDHETVGEEIAYWKQMEAEGRTLLPQGIYDKQRYAVAACIAAAEADLFVASWKGRGKTLFQTRKPEPTPEARVEPPAWKPTGPILIAGFQNGEAWLVEEHREGEWLVLFRERGKEDRLDPKNPLPFPTAEEAARAIGRRCRDDREAADRDVWRNGPLGLTGWLAYGEAVQEREMEDLKRRQETASIAQATEPQPEPARETLDLGAEVQEVPEFHGLKGPKGKKVCPGPAGYSVWEFGEGFRCYHDETGLVLRDMLDEPADFWSVKSAMAYLRDVQCGLNAAALAQRGVDGVSPTGVARAVAIPDNGEGPADPAPDTTAQGPAEGPADPARDATVEAPVLLEEPEQGAAGYHVGAMMTGNTSLGEGAQILAYFTETAETAVTRKRREYGVDLFGGFLYLARDESGYRLRRHGGAGKEVDRPLDGVFHGERGDALAAAREWLRTQDPLREVGFIHHFACESVVPRFTTYAEYMTEILRKAGFNYRMIETADRRIHTQDYGCTVTPDGTGVFVRRAENGEEADRVRFDDIVRIWNGIARSAEGLRQEGIVVWCREDIPAFAASVFCEATDKDGATTWRGKDGYLAFRAIPNEKMGYVLERCNTTPGLSAFIGYAKDLVEARAKLGVPPRSPGYGDEVEADPKVVAREIHGETSRCWAVEPDVDGEIRVLSGPPDKEGRWMYLRTVATEEAALAYLGGRFSNEPGFHWAWEAPAGRPQVARRFFVVNPERLAEGRFQYTAGHKNGVLVGEGDIHAARSAHRVSDPGAYKVPSIAPPFTNEDRLWMTAGCDERKAVAYELVPLDLWDGPTLAYEALPRDETGQLTQGYHGLLVRHGKDRYVCLGDAADFVAAPVGAEPEDLVLTPPAMVLRKRRLVAD